MTAYIVCPSKRNAPRMNIAVCTTRCSAKEECSAYKAYLEALLVETTPPLHRDAEKVSAAAS